MPNKKINYNDDSSVDISLEQLEKWCSRKNERLKNNNKLVKLFHNWAEHEGKVKRNQTHNKRFENKLFMTIFVLFSFSLLTGLNFFIFKNRKFEEKENNLQNKKNIDENLEMIIDEVGYSLVLASCIILGFHIMIPKFKSNEKNLRKKFVLQMLNEKKIIISDFASEKKLIVTEKMLSKWRIGDASILEIKLKEHMYQGKLDSDIAKKYIEYKNLTQARRVIYPLIHIGLGVFTYILKAFFEKDEIKNIHNLGENRENSLYEIPGSLKLAAYLAVFSLAPRLISVEYYNKKNTENYIRSHIKENKIASIKYIENINMSNNNSSFLNDIQKRENIIQELSRN